MGDSGVGLFSKDRKSENGKDVGTGYFSPGNDLWKRGIVKRKYETAKDLEDGLTAYFEWCDQSPWVEEKVFGTGLRANINHPRPPSIKAACVHLGISKATWDTYRGLDTGHGDVIDMAETYMTAIKTEGAAVGMWNGNIIARDLGLGDKLALTHAATVHLEGDDAAL